MKASEFTQLHLHTYFSILDGVPSPEEYVEKAKALGMKSIGITDHGTMSSVLRFSNACVKAGIKPIIGCEFYVNDHREKREIGSNNHLVLLAKNEVGYKNLLKINYDAMKNGFYYRGRTTTEMVLKHSEGVICMTACLGSIFGKLILEDKIVELRFKLSQYKKTFGKDFYIELQFNETDAQLKVTPILNKLAKELNIKTVMTGDCHYIEPGDEETQSVQLMVNTRKTMSDENIFRFSARNLFFHVPEDYLIFNKEMNFNLPVKDVTQAMENTKEISDKCNYIIEKSDSKFPRFIDKDGYEVNADILLKEKIKIGVKKLFPNGISKQYKQRLNKEMDVVSKKRFSDYFLIIEDIIRFCEIKDIAVGAGRGSAAGSLISFVLGITRIDPLKYDLLFERFLNRDRQDPPDIDLDFESKRKPEIEQYLRKKYGDNRVAHIITFSTFRLKGAIRDVARVYEKEKDSDFLTIIKKLPDEPEINLKEINLYKQMMGQLFTKSEKAYIKVNKEIFDLAGALVGKIRQKGSHAGGTAITPGPIYDYVPVDNIKGEIVTGFIEGKDYRELSDIGVLKIDILGLKTIDIIKNTLDMIKKYDDEEVDIHSINLNDPILYKAINKYSSIGIFQFENQAIDAYLKRVEPFCFDDIVTINALYRPALINANEHEKYIHRRKKIIQWEEENECSYKGKKTELTKILKPTYGTIVFQEQFMIILQKLGGFTLEEADKARKTFKILYLRRQDTNKKKEDPELLKVTNQFMSGAKENTDMSVKEIQSLINKLAEFAEYAFNKSHSVSYSVISMQTLYLREYYPKAFYSALLNWSDNSIKQKGFRKENEMKKYISYIKSRGIEFVPIDINNSGISFHPQKMNFDYPVNCITLPLTFVPGIGESFAVNIVTNAPYSSFSNFLIKELSFKSNKTSILNLITIGAFDNLNSNRKALHSFYEEWASVKSKHKKKKLDKIKPIIKEIWNRHKDEGDFTKSEKMEMEKIICKFNLFEIDGESIRKIEVLRKNKKISTLSEKHKKRRYCFKIESVKTIKDKNGRTMAFYDIEDWKGKTMEAVSFSNVYSQIKDVEGDKFYAVKGYIDDGGKLIIGEKNNYGKVVKPFISIESLKNI